MNPIRYEGEVAIFSNLQVDILGDPSYYGYENYLVMDSEPNYVLSATHWDQSFLKKIHRYSRIARFKTTVRNLLGDGMPNLEPQVYSMIKIYVKPDTTNPYESCRKVLKHFGFSKYYRHIPALLNTCLKKTVIVIPSDKRNNMSSIIQEIYTRFVVFENLFFQLNSRKYFPNMKYTALRIMTGLGLENPYIPLLRTKRKVKSLDLFFESMENLLKSQAVNKVS